MVKILIKLLRISFLFFITVNAIGSVVFYEPLSGRKPPGSSRKIDKDLVVYVERFEKLWGKKIEFPVLFNNLSGLTAGKCTVWFFGDKVVEIDPEYFFILSDIQIEELMFHELGHCALKRMEHTNDKILFKGESIKAPKSIMYQTIFNSVYINFYIKYREYYINELFGR